MRAAAWLGGLAVAVALGVSAVAFHPMAALGIAAAIAALFWVFSNSLNATLAFIVVLLLRPADHFPALAALQPAKAVAVVAILAWLFATLLRADKRLSRAPQGKWIVALAGGLIISSTLSSYPGSSWRFYTDVFIKILIMYGLIVQLVHTKPQAVRLHLSLALCTVALAVGAIYVRLAGLATIEGNRAGLAGLLGDPNDLALVLVIYAPFFVELALGSRGPRRVFGVMMFCVLAFGVLATISRGGALGLAAGLACTFYDRGRLHTRLLVIPAVTAALAVLLIAAGVNERASGGLRSGRLDDSAASRLDFWQAGVRMMAHNPISGVGLAQFSLNYPRYARNAISLAPKDAHNSFIKAAGETGLVGFVPFMALVFLTIRTGYRTRKKDDPDESPMERAVRRSLFPSIVGFCVSAFFLSQCWSWFMFILFAEGAVAYELWGADPAPALDEDAIGTMPASQVQHG